MKYLHLIATLSTAFAANVALHADAAPTTQSDSEPPFMEYHNRIAVFETCHLTYERTETDALYVGLEGWCVPVLTKHHRHHHALAEGEFRMGYNFFWNQRDHFTPVAGVGYLQQFHRKHWNLHKQRSGIVYGTVGFIYDHEFTKTVNLGLNLKGLLGGSVSNRHHKHHNWGNPVVGIDISVPLTFRFGYKRRWDLRIEPFDIYLHGRDHSANYFGGRSTVGFRF